MFIMLLMHALIPQKKKFNGYSLACHYFRVISNALIFLRYEGQRDMLYNQTFNLDQVAFASEGLKDAQQTVCLLNIFNHRDYSKVVQFSTYIWLLVILIYR